VRGSPEIDYLVIGEGVVSLSTAHYIKKNSPKSRVVVVDKNPGSGMGDTSRSAAMFKVFFSSRVNVMITKSSVEFYKHVERSLGRDLGIRCLGYLFLVDVEELERMRPALERFFRSIRSNRIRRLYQQKRRVLISSTLTIGWRYS